MVEDYFPLFIFVHSTTSFIILFDESKNLGYANDMELLDGSVVWLCELR